jgi:hypothetical protein
VRGGGDDYGFAIYCTAPSHAERLVPTPHHGAKPCDGVAQLIRRIVACRRRPSPGRLRKLHVCCFEPPVCTVHAVTDASTMSEDRTQWGSPLRSFRWALRRLRWHQRLACFLHFTRSALPRRGEQPRPADGRGRRRPWTAADGPYSCSHSKLNICHRCGRVGDARCDTMRDGADLFACVLCVFSYFMVVVGVQALAAAVGTAHRHSG